MRDPLGNDTTIAYDRPYHLLPVQVTDAVGLTIERRARLPRPATPHGHGCQRQPPRRDLQPLGIGHRHRGDGEGRRAGRRHARGARQPPGVRLLRLRAYAHDRNRSRSSSAASSASITSRRPTCRCRSGTRPSRPSSIPTASGGCCRPARRPRTSCSATRSSAAASCPPISPSPTGDAVGRRRAPGDPPNVIVSGWQVYDNKGRVVEKYEPFFSVGWDYAPPERRPARPKGHDVLRSARPGDPHAQSRWLGAAGDLWDPGRSRPTPTSSRPRPGRPTPTTRTIWRR